MRHDKDLLKNSLTMKDIEGILYKLGAQTVNINEQKNEIVTNTVCHNTSGGSLKLYYLPLEEDPYFRCYTGCSCTMDVYELVRRNFELKGVTLRFDDTVNWVAENTGRSFGFGNSSGVAIADNEELEWLNRIRKKKKIEFQEPETYSDRVLDNFEWGYYHESFLNDHISVEAMKKFEIGFYSKENRIVIPHRHPTSGEIMGIRGRALNKWEEDKFKYLPLTVQGHMFKFPTYCQLYGFWQNMETIKRLKKVVLFESEKSVMQCEAYFPDNNFSLALMGRNISQYQIDLLLNVLGVEEVILAYDKMFEHGNDRQRERDVNFLLSVGRRFSPYVRTYVLFDTDNLVEYKDSPSDFGKETLIQLMMEKQEILNID